jgi:hypothetical protein
MSHKGYGMIGVQGCYRYLFSTLCLAFSPLHHVQSLFCEALAALTPALALSGTIRG